MKRQPWNTIKVLGLAAIAELGSILLPGHAHAQDVFRGMRTESGLQTGEIFQRFKAELPTAYQNITITQDHKPGKDDVLSISLASTEERTWNYGLGFYRLGDVGDRRRVLGEAWARTNLLGAEVFFDMGYTIETTYDELRWTLGSIKAKGVQLEGAVLDDHGPSADVTKVFWSASAGNDNLYAGIGNNNGKWVPVLGTRSGTDFGNMTFAHYTPADGGNPKKWKFRSQTGIGDINTEFYNAGLFSYAISYMSLPPFHDVKFSNFTTKGNWTILAAGHGEGSNSHIQLLAGRRLMKGLGAGVGISQTQTETGTTYGAPMEMNWNVTVKDVNVNAEIKTDLSGPNETNTTAYIQTSIPIGKERNE